MDERTDEAIVARVKEGDAESFGLIVERYEAKIRRYAKKFLLEKEDAEDLMQEVFIKAYTNIQSFRKGERFSPWLYRIAHNEFINAIKKNRRTIPFFDIDVIFPSLSSSETADSAAEKRNIRETLDRSLTEVPPKYREPLILHYFEELSYQDISEILRIPISTVGVRLTRGRALLKKRYEK